MGASFSALTKRSSTDLEDEISIQTMEKQSAFNSKYISIKANSLARKEMKLLVYGLTRHYIHTYINHRWDYNDIASIIHLYLTSDIPCVNFHIKRCCTQIDGSTQRINWNNAIFINKSLKDRPNTSITISNNQCSKCDVGIYQIQLYVLGIETRKCKTFIPRILQTLSTYDASENHVTLQYLPKLFIHTTDVRTWRQQRCKFELHGFSSYCKFLGTEYQKEQRNKNRNINSNNNDNNTNKSKESDSLYQRFCEGCSFCYEDDGRVKDKYFYSCGKFGGFANYSCQGMKRYSYNYSGGDKKKNDDLQYCWDDRQNEFHTTIEMRYDQTKKELTFWKNKNMLIGKNAQMVNLKNELMYCGQFNQGVFKLSHGFSYYPLIGCYGCDCTDSGIVVGYDSL